MRTTFIQALAEIAEKDDRVWLVCGDLGYSVLETFAERFPGRFLNAGVAEQNMTGIAAGLALSGKIVFTYSIANFAVMRCLEQIRNDICYHNLDVKIVAVGGGLAYGPAGYTHHAVEDLAVMRAMPHMTVLAPGDPVETRLVMQRILDRRGPCYLRLGKAGEPIVHASVPAHFEIGKAIEVRPGEDATLMTTGGTLQLTVQAAEVLARAGRSVRVLSMPTVEPLDTEAILAAGRVTKRIVTVEEHGRGGLSAGVAEILATSGMAVQFFPLRLADEPVVEGGSQEFLRAAQGLSVRGVVDAAQFLLDGG